MAIYKVTMFLDLGKGGWTESYYWDGPDSFATPTLFSVGTQQFGNAPGAAGWYGVCQARVSLLCQSGALSAIRFANVAIPRSGYLDESVQLLTPGYELPRDVRRRAYKCPVNAGNTGAYRRTVTLRGVPDATIAFQASGHPQSRLGIAAFCQTYFEALKAVGAALKVLKKNVPGDNQPVVPITNVERQGILNSGMIITAPGHGLTDTTAIRIRGCKFIDAAVPININGIWEATPFVDTNHAAGTAFTIPVLWNVGFAGFRYVGGGNVQKREYAYPRITRADANDGYFGQHRTGRPFGAERGRSSPARLFP